MEATEINTKKRKIHFEIRKVLSLDFPITQMEVFSLDGPIFFF